MGIEMIKKGLSLVIETFREVGELTSAVGLIDQLQKLYALSNNVVDATSLTVEQLFAEFKALDDEKRADLIGHLSDELTLENAELEAKIEKTFAFVMRAESVVRDGIEVAELWIPNVQAA